MDGFRVARKALLRVAVTSVLGATACSQTRIDERSEVSVGVATQALTSQTTTFEVALPVGVEILEPALWSSIALSLRDGVRVSATGSNPDSGLSIHLGSGDSLFGNEAVTRSISSVGRVQLGHRARVNGSVISESTVVPQTNVVVTGTVTHNGDLDPRSLRRWQVQFPGTTQGDITVPANSSRTLAPGHYEDVVAYGNSTLRLSAGTYTFVTLQVEPGAKLRVDDQNGPVFVYVRTGLNYKGVVEAADGGAPELLLGYAGSLATVIDAAFRGTLVAPFATATLAAVTHKGAFFARRLDVRAQARVEHVPFGGWPVTAPADFDADGAADSVDNCPTDANPTQTDTDADGLGDACDSCASQPDQDRDGICNAVDNCPAVSNVDQRDMNANGAGDACDAQRCYAPITIQDRQRALAIALARPELAATVNTGRYRALEFGTVCPSLGPTAPRRVKLSVYDYARRENRDIVANLDSGAAESVLLTQRQPTEAAEEKAEAFAIANAHATVQSRIAATGSELDLTTFNVNTGSLPVCRTTRCIDVIYSKRNGQGAIVPPEPYAASVDFTGEQLTFRALVDLSTRQVVSVSDM